MSEDDINKDTVGEPVHRDAVPKKRNDWRDIFKLPTPVRQTFDQFPLVVYPTNEPPQRAPRPHKNHALHVFSTLEDARHNSPSFNPSCLKWQVYLKSCGIDFHVVLSNNHASPTGSLPFLLPRPSSSAPSTAPVPSKKLQRWAKEHGSAVEEKEALRGEAYMALLDHRIRRAWLYMLYVQPDNFNAVAKRLYVQSASSNFFVNAVTSHQLQTAAIAEIQKTTPSVSELDLIEDGQEALSALSTLLGTEEWFFGSEKPGLFDASVFAYTHLLQDEKMGWKENQLGNALQTLENLVEHRNRLLRLYF